MAVYLQGGRSVAYHFRGDSDCDSVVFYDYTCWDEDERPNLAIVAYLDAFLDVHVRVYLCVLAYLAAVEVYLVVDSRVASYLCIVDDGVFCWLHFLTGISGINGNETCTVRSWNIDSLEASNRETTRAPSIPSE